MCITDKYLRGLINKAADVQTKWHNGEATEAEADSACNRVNKAAAKKGYAKIDWNHGLYPVLTAQDGTEYQV